MVNLSTLKAGDTVKFRDGRSDVVDEIEKLEEGDYDYFVFCSGVDYSSTFTEDGFFNNNRVICGKDIVEIIPKEQPTTDAVNHPSHYTSGGIECIAAIKASMSSEEYRGYLKGNVLKYVWRYKNKNNPVEDLKKAKVYLEWLIKEVGE